MSAGTYAPENIDRLSLLATLSITFLSSAIKSYGLYFCIELKSMRSKVQFIFVFKCYPHIYLASATAIET